MRWRLLVMLLLASLAACGGESDPVVLTIPPTPTEPEALAEATNTPTETATITLSPNPTSTATMTPTDVPPTATPSPSPSPTPSPMPTATPEPTPTVAAGSVVIIDIIYDPPEGRDSDGETVFITNQSEDPVDMTGWTLSDIAEHIYMFPAFTLQPGATVAVHICDGEDSDEILYWGRCSAVWNNDGDTAYLRDASGREISSYSY